MHRTWVVAAATVVLVLGVAGGAHAAPIALGGSPLNVYVDNLGQLQAFMAGQSSGIFSRPTSTTGDAGFFLAELDGVDEVDGFTSTTGPGSPIVPYTNVVHDPVTGSGTASDPFTQMTAYITAGTDLDVTQTTTYVNGSREFRVQWLVHNMVPGSVHFKALAAADVFFDGFHSSGVSAPGPPQRIGLANVTTGASTSFVEVPGSSPWSRFQVLPSGRAPGEGWNIVANAAASPDPTLNNTVFARQSGNAAAVEWDQYATGPGLGDDETATFEVVVRTAAPVVQISPSSANGERGEPVNFTVSARDTAGTPYAGKQVGYQITAGANEVSRAATVVGADGNAVVTDPGLRAGTDTLVAFLDLNGDGVRGAAEPQVAATAIITDTIAPRCPATIGTSRPGGSGPGGKPLVVTVSCDEGSLVTLQTVLRPKSTRKRAAAAAARKKPVTITLKSATVSLAANTAVSIARRLPGAVRRKYAGKTLKATVSVTAHDSTGNVRKTTVTRDVKLAKVKKARKKRR
jgi:hypothetical protein